MALISKTALSDQILDVLRERVINGGFPEGSIRQDALAAELGVSKIPLREAFAKLEQEGLIVSQANRGYFVSPLSQAEAYDVFDLRLRLEPPALAEAAIGWTEAERVQAADALEQCEAAVADARPDLGARHRAFHMALARPCRRPITLQTLERLHAIAERYTIKHLERSGRRQRASKEHRGLFEAWVARDPARLAALAAAHVNATLADLERELEGERKRKSA